MAKSRHARSTSIATPSSTKSVRAGRRWSRGKQGGATGAVAMRSSIGFVTLAVRDVAKSRAFYEALGLVASERSRPDLALFQMNGLVLALASHAVMRRERGVGPATRRGTGSVTLSHNVRAAAEVGGLLDRARWAGGRVLRDAGAAPWGGTTGWFADLDGHVWEVVYNERVILDAKGNLYLEPPGVW